MFFLNYMMYMSWIKFVSFSLFLFSIVFSFLENSMFLYWICLEMNLFTFVGLMKNDSQTTINFMMKYYVIQSIMSGYFLLFFIFHFQCENLMSSVNMIFIMIWFKMGLFPFSNWYFNISENIEWVIWFLLNTFQKLIPLLIISKNLISLNLMNLFIFMNSLFSSFEIMFQNSMRWFMNASSMNHFSWIFLSMNNLIFFWEIYFFMYLFMLFFLFKMVKILNMNSFNCFLNMNFNYLLIIMILIMNFMGVPPFLGFYLKFVVIMNCSSFMMVLILLMINIYLCFFYLNFMLLKFNINMFFSQKIFKNYILYKLLFFFFFFIKYFNSYLYFLVY